MPVVANYCSGSRFVMFPKGLKASSKTRKIVGSNEFEDSHYASSIFYIYV